MREPRSDLSKTTPIQRSRKMTHLFWKDKEGTKNLLSSDFTSEQEFENLILNHQELLGDDIFLISSQVRGGKKRLAK